MYVGLAEHPPSIVPAGTLAALVLGPKLNRDHKVRAISGSAYVGRPGGGSWACLGFQARAQRVLSDLSHIRGGAAGNFGRLYSYTNIATSALPAQVFF